LHEKSVLELPREPDASTRPSRLPRGIEVLTTIIVAASFITGALFWWGQTQLAALQPPRWLETCRVAHGCLNPLTCVLFGYLLCQHIRYGWALKINRPSGFVVEIIIAGLIISAVGLYYIGNETIRNWLVWAHRILGMALPVSFIGHWMAARRWIKNSFK
jgi:hypothetical protein